MNTMKFVSINEFWNADFEKQKYDKIKQNNEPH